MELLLKNLKGQRRLKRYNKKRRGYVWVKGH